MKRTIKLFSLVFLLVLTFSFLRASTVHAALIVSNGMAASLVLGQPNFTSNTTATTQTGMNFPYGAAVDPTTGKVFIADFTNHRVLRFASVTSLTNGSAAEAVLGQPNFTSNTSATTQSGMNAPRAVFVDAAGRLWVGEVANHRVLRFDNASSLGNGANADGVLGQTLFTTNASATTQNGMWLPEGIFVDSAGRLWVADSNNYRVLRFDNAAAKSNGANADGVLGQTLFTTRVATTSQSGMFAPYGVHLDSAGRLWVADHVNNRLLRFDNAAASPNGDNADGVLGQPNFTSNASATTQSGMANPTGVTGNDNTGQIFLADRNNNRVLVFNNAAAKVNGDNADNVIGQANFTSNGAGLTATTLNNPYRIYFDPGAEVLWVGDGTNNRMLMYGAGCPSSLTVMNNSDSGSGSLRQAMADVCPGGTITFDNALSGQTITLASTLPINQNLTIDGSSLSPPVTVSGGNAVRVFHVTGGTVNLESLTVANGLITGGVCAGCGAGLLIENGATVTVNNSTFSGHTAEHGGAIENWNGSLTVTHSTFANNTTTVGGGAAINVINPSTALIANSTFSSNNGGGGGWGGGIYSQGTVTLVNNTFSGNGAASGGGIYNNGGTMHNTNNIFANATLGGDCAGTAPATNVNNLVEDGSCSPTLTGDPLLDPTGLQDNGGSTQTFALQAGSAAINAGDNTACAAAPVNNLDQRGVPRPQGAQCDIGSYEYVYSVTPGGSGGLGPGGVGHTDGSTTLELWLQAGNGVFTNVGCTTVATNGDDVACWQDQSGNGYNFTQADPTRQPNYFTGIKNNQPVLRFYGDGNADNLDSSAVLTAGDDTFTYFASWMATISTIDHVIFEQNHSSAVTGMRAALIAIPSARYGFNGLSNDFHNAAPYVANQFEVSSVILNGNPSNNVLVYDSGRSYVGTIDIITQNVGAGSSTVGRYTFANGFDMRGDIPEILVFSDALNDTDRILVENYLSAKYDVPLDTGNGAVDVYDGDTNGNGDFDLDVAGIGQFGGNNHTQAHAAGMIVVNDNFLQDNGDWLLFGHRTLANSNSTADLPTGGDWDGNNDVRWARHWYVDVTDAAGVNCATPGTCFVDIIFDFSEAGMNGGLPPNGLASNYRLLKRTLGTGPFSDVATATAIVDDQVQFLNVDVSLLGSNFTLGSLNGATSPTAITLQHAAHSISQLGYPLLIAVMLVLLMAVTTVVWRRRA